MNFKFTHLIILIGIEEIKPIENKEYSITEQTENTIVNESNIETQTYITNTTTLSTYQPGIHSSQINKQTNKQTNKRILSSSHTFDI
jgi:hypothetical protein